MEKILNKSKSRYFFGGKKKSAKDQGISSSDIPVPISGSGSEGLGGRSTLSHTTPRTFHPDDPPITPSGPWPHHARNSPEVNNTTSEYPHFSKRRIGNPVSALEIRSQDFGPPPQSRFEVHISPTAFSPIMMPSSTPPRSLESPPASAPPQRLDFGREHRTADSPRAGDIHSHSRSQSAFTPVQSSSSHVRMRHGIPEAFMDNNRGTASETQRWNVQNAGTDRYTSDSLRNMSSADTSLVHPSASAPTTSHFSKLHGSLGLPDLAPLRGSSTVPNMSAHSPLPRSNPSYNLAGLTPTSSATPSPPISPVDANTRTSSRAHRGQPSHESDRPRRDPPPPPHSASRTTVSGYSTVPHMHSNNHHANTSTNSDKEIGYKGLVFPLPPSSEEGLAMSYSSSQSSLFSIVPGRRAGETPVTPKRAREGKGERDAKTPTSTGVASERSSREKSFRPSEDRTSPTPNMGTHGRHRDPDTSYASGTDTDAERETIRNTPECVGKAATTALDADLQESGPGKRPAVSAQNRATSEANRETPDSVRRPPQPPRVSEPTKPLSLAPGRKALHTVRSFSTGLNDRKQIHASASNRDLTSCYNNLNGRGDHVNTALPLPPPTQRDVPKASSKSDTKLPMQSRFTLPTPPHSSSALSCVAGGQELSGGPPQNLTLEDVTNALRTQHSRFDELAGYVLNMAQRHTAERDAYVGRMGHLESAVAKMGSEIRGLRWLVMEHVKTRPGPAEEPATSAAVEGGEGDDAERKLRRSITMPQLVTIPPHRPKHPRSKRDAIGLGLGFSPDSVLSPPAKENPRQSLPAPDEDDGTPSMDEIIDKLMGVRQWANADVRVSIVDAGGSAGDGGDTKKIVFRERRK